MIIDEGVKARFIEKVRFSPKTSCWLWTGAKNPYGYGCISVQRKTVLAHRLAYEILVEPIPEGLVIDHLCRVPSCVNPAHLEPVTSAENTRRGDTVQSKHCRRGHERTKENTYVSSTGARACRMCQNTNQSKRTKARRAAQIQEDTT